MSAYSSHTGKKKSVGSHRIERRRRRRRRRWENASSLTSAVYGLQSFLWPSSSSSNPKARLTIKSNKTLLQFKRIYNPLFFLKKKSVPGSEEEEISAARGRNTGSPLEGRRRVQAPGRALQWTATKYNY